MEPVLADVLDSKFVRRLAVKGGEVGDGVGVDLLAVRRHVAHLHVFDHVPAQRGNRLGHRGNSCRFATCNPDRRYWRVRLFASPNVAELILCDVSEMARLSHIPPITYRRWSTSNEQ